MNRPFPPPKLIGLHEGIMAFEFLHEPIQRASVFSKLTFKPDTVCKHIKDLENERSEPSKIIVLTSAYCDILHSEFRNLIPQISVSFLTALPKISEPKMNK